MFSNELVSFAKVGKQPSLLVAKGRVDERRTGVAKSTAAAVSAVAPVAVKPMTDWPAPAPALRIAPLAVTSIGNWPMRRWMVQAVHEHMQGRLDEAAFQATADDAVRLARAAQAGAGVDLLTGGEQRRDSYARFVASRLDNCQLIPLTDLLPLVDDPEEFERELRALDVPVGDVRHPAGETDVLKRLPDEFRIGVGACNWKHARTESVESIVAQGERAIQLFGVDRVLLTPDCGFATLADNPLSSDAIAEAKLAALVQAARTLRERHRVGG